MKNLGIIKLFLLVMVSFTVLFSAQYIQDFPSSNPASSIIKADEEPECPDGYTFNPNVEMNDISVCEKSYTTEDFFTGQVPYDGLTIGHHLDNDDRYMYIVTLSWDETTIHANCSMGPPFYFRIESKNFMVVSFKKDIYLEFYPEATVPDFATLIITSYKYPIAGGGAGGGGTSDIGIKSPDLGYDRDPWEHIKEISQTIIKYIVVIAGVISLIVIIVGGYYYISSAGDESKAQQGKNAVIGAVIGLIISMLAWAIVSFLAGDAGFIGGPSL